MTELLLIPSDYESRNIIQGYIEKSPFNGKWDVRNGYFSFEVTNGGDCDSLEYALDNDLKKLGLNYRFEAQ